MPGMLGVEAPMQRSDTRILTTHAGSLPRPQRLTEAFIRQSRGESVDRTELGQLVTEATRRVVERQRDAGIDVGGDGEQSRESFFTYVRHRLSGFGGASVRPLMRDLLRYPSFVEQKLPEFARPMVSLMSAPQAVGPVRYLDPAAAVRDVERYAAVLADVGPGFVESFMTAPSPGIVACAMQNAYYPGLPEYVDALAAALRTEYEAIVAHGLVLQVDCPDLAMERHTLFADRPLDEFLAFVDLVIDALNRALAGCAADRVRLHVCWGNYEGPHDLDVPLEELLPHLYRARVGALVLSMANPRHAHEHRCFVGQPLPAGWLLVAGVIDTTTNYVEHPEVVAERLERAAAAVGDPRRVLAGTDCGFDTAAGLGTVADDVVWAKLRALREGADLATRRLLASSGQPTAPGRPA
jgi:5-methyltetrahydropteroyltriglutamate--homocysteine methyltransferase